MSKFTIFISVAVVYIFCIVTGRGVHSSGVNLDSNNILTSALSPRTVPRLSTAVAAARLYSRLLRKELTSGDEEDLNGMDDEKIENYFNKRGYDDYGHMRFGKRTPALKDFDDYGHMRFGK